MILFAWVTLILYVWLFFTSIVFSLKLGSDGNKLTQIITSALILMPVVVSLMYILRG